MPVVQIFPNTCEHVESLAKRKMLLMRELAKLTALKSNALEGSLR
jgi:hypothetical protein